MSKRRARITDKERGRDRRDYTRRGPFAARFNEQRKLWDIFNELSREHILRTDNVTMVPMLNSAWRSGYAQGYIAAGAAAILAERRGKRGYGL